MVVLGLVFAIDLEHVCSFEERIEGTLDLRLRELAILRIES